uniref:Uncharacterized protein n=1 Tax=Branchiostoma floridae TaxID=7739 RepID=C3ZTC3_BRAFL|eukprot:XP_002588159.1 hypothetical protein BRAFLDRAFT_68797 [Branchiostoma floridae]
MPAPLVLPLLVTVFVLFVSWLLSRDKSAANVTKRRDVRVTNERTVGRAARFERRTNGGLQTIAEVSENNGGLDNGANRPHDKFANCHLRLTLTIKEVLPTQSTFQRQLSGRAIENVVRSKSGGIREFTGSRGQRQDHQTTHGGKSDDISVRKDAESVNHHQEFNLESRVTRKASEEFESRCLSKYDSRGTIGTGEEERNPGISEGRLYSDSHLKEQVLATNLQSNIKEKYTFENCGKKTGPKDLPGLFGTFESGKANDSLRRDDVTGKDVTGGCLNDLERFAPPETDTGVSNTTDNTTKRREVNQISALLSVVPSETEDLIHEAKCDGRQSEPVISNSPCLPAPSVPREGRETSGIISKPCLRDLSNAREMALKSILRNSPSKESLNKICERGQKVTEEANKNGGRRDVDSTRVTAVHTIAGKRKEIRVSGNNLSGGSNAQTDQNHRKKQLPEKTSTEKTESSTQTTNALSRFNSNDNVQSQCSKELRSSSRSLTSPCFLETEIPSGEDFYPERDVTGSCSLPAEEISSDKITIADNSDVCENSESVRSGTYTDSPLSSAQENPPIGFIFVISKRRGSKQITGGLSESEGIPGGHKNDQERKDLGLNKAAIQDKERAVESKKQGGKGHSYQSCQGIKWTAEQKTDLQQGKQAPTRNTGAIIRSFEKANKLAEFGIGTEGAINTCLTGPQKSGFTSDCGLESPTSGVNVIKEGGKLNGQKCGLEQSLNSKERAENGTKSVTFKLEREIVETTEGQKQRARLNVGVKPKCKDTKACGPGNGLELSEFESALTTPSENRHSGLPPYVGSVNSGTKASQDTVDSELLDSGSSNIKGKCRNMDGRKYPVHSTEVQQVTEDRTVDMPSFWQACDLTDSDTTSTLSSPTFGSSTNASYGGSSSNSSSDFDVWKFDWALKKKKREKRGEDTTARILRKSDATIAETTTDSSEDLEGSVLKSVPDVQYKQASKEVYSLTNRQTCENGASTHISNNREQINPAAQRLEGDGVQVLQGNLTGTDHLDKPMYGAKVTSSATDTSNQFAKGRTFALVAAGRPNGQQRPQTVKGDRNRTENVPANFFDANFPNGRVFVALGTKGEVAREINGAASTINEDLTSREISVAGETSGGTTARGHSGHGSSGRSAVRCGAEERVSARGESANKAEEAPLVTSPLPVITVTSDDEDRPQTNVIFSKDDNNTSLDDLNRCNNAVSGLDIKLTRSFWTQSCDPLPEDRKVVEQINGWEEKAGSLPDVRAATTRKKAVFSENFKRLRHARIANSVDVLSRGSLNEFGVVSDLHPQKVGCEEGDTLSARFPSSKGTDTVDTCQNSRSGIENTGGTVTAGDRQQFSRTHSGSEMVVLSESVPRHGRNGEERYDNRVRTEGQGMLHEKRRKENGDVRHLRVESTDKISPRPSEIAMESNQTAPFFRSETHIEIPATKPLRRQDSLTKSSGVFFSSLDFVNKPSAERSGPKTTGRATDLDSALRRHQENGNFNLISTFPGDGMGARGRAKGHSSSTSPRHEQRKARMLRSRSKSPNEVRVQDALRKLDLPGWYVNSDVANVGTASPVLKRSRSAETTLSDSGVGTLPRQNQGDQMSSPTGEDSHPLPRKISPPSGQEPGPYRGRRQSREERLSEFYSQRNLHPYPNRRNSQDVNPLLFDKTKRCVNQAGLYVDAK